MSAGNREWCPPCLSAAQRRVCQDSGGSDLLRLLGYLDTPAMPSLQLRLQKDFSFHAFPCIFCFIVWDELLDGLRVPASGCHIGSCHSAYKFQNYLAEGCKKGMRENRLTAILPQSSRSFSRYSRRSSFGLCSIPPSFCRKLVIQTQISLNVIATVYKLTICHNLILCLTASSQKVGGEYGMWEKAPIREAEDLGWQYPSTHPPYRQC